MLRNQEERKKKILLYFRYYFRLKFLPADVNSFDITYFHTMFYWLVCWLVVNDISTFTYIYIYIYIYICFE